MLEVIEWLRDQVTKLVQWLFDLALWVPRKVLETVTDGLVALLDGVSVPGWIASASGALGGMPDGVYWFMSMMAVSDGFAIISGAWVIRFLIRRIPFIG